MSTERMVSVEQSLDLLNERFFPKRKSRRWLVEFLHRCPTDAHGRPLYRLAGRDKLVYIDRLFEALPCPSKSSKPATRKRKTSTSAGATSESQLIEAAELTGDWSLVPSSSDSKNQSSGENTRPKKPHLIVNNQRS